MRISDWSSDVCSSDLDRRIERLREGGIVFHENFEVGRDATLEQLRARHDAILVATGVYKPRAIRAPGIGSAGVVEARSEERRVGKEGGRTCRSGGSPVP